MLRPVLLLVTNKKRIAVGCIDLPYAVKLTPFLFVFKVKATVPRECGFLKGL